MAQNFPLKRPVEALSELNNLRRFLNEKMTKLEIISY